MAMLSFFFILFARATPVAIFNCAAIVDACRQAPKSAAEIVPVLFRRILDPHQMGFAFSEVLAHVNYLVRQGRLAGADGADGVKRFTAQAAS